MWRLAECPREQTMVVIWRKIRFARCIGEPQGLIDCRGDVIARTAQAPEKLVVDQRAEAVGRRIDQRMRHAASLADSSFTVEPQFLPTSLMTAPPTRPYPAL